MTNLLVFVCYFLDYPMNIMKCLLKLINNAMCLRSWIMDVIVPQLLIQVMCTSLTLLLLVVTSILKPVCNQPMRIHEWNLNYELLDCFLATLANWHPCTIWDYKLVLLWSLVSWLLYMSCLLYWFHIYFPFIYSKYEPFCTQN